MDKGNSNRHHYEIHVMWQKAERQIDPKTLDGSRFLR
jgi:hypothetical protein